MGERPPVTGLSKERVWSEKLRKRVRTLGREVGQIEAEIRWRQGRKRERGRRRLRGLLKLLGRRQLNFHSLKVERERRRARLRIELSKLREADQCAQRQEEMEAYGMWGPGSLDGRGEAKREVGKDEVQAIGDFWKGIWETEGSYSPGHLDLEGWARETRRRVDETEREDPMEWMMAWARAVKKAPN